MSAPRWTAKYKRRPRNNASWVRLAIDRFRIYFFLSKVLERDVFVVRRKAICFEIIFFQSFSQLTDVFNRLNQRCSRASVSLQTCSINWISAAPELQSAYRRVQSTESALLKVFSDIIDAIDKDCLVLILRIPQPFSRRRYCRPRYNAEALVRSFLMDGTSMQWIVSYLIVVYNQSTSLINQPRL